MGRCCRHNSVNMVFGASSMKHKIVVALAILLGKSLTASAQVSAYVNFCTSRVNGSGGMTFLYAPAGWLSANGD